MMLLLFHAVFLYFIGAFLAYGYIDLNNKFEQRRDKSGQKFGQKYKDYKIKKKNMLKSLYFFFEVYILKKY